MDTSAPTTSAPTTSAPTTSAPTTSAPFFRKDTFAPRQDTLAPHEKTLRLVANDNSDFVKDASAPSNSAYKRHILFVRIRALKSQLNLFLFMNIS